MHLALTIILPFLSLYLGIRIGRFVENAQMKNRLALCKDAEIRMALHYIAADEASERPTQKIYRKKPHGQDA